MGVTHHTGDSGVLQKELSSRLHAGQMDLSHSFSSSQGPPGTV